MATAKQREDLTGRRFARLTVEGLHSIRWQHSLWTCACDCGNSTVVDGSKLKSGRIKSCGCWRADPAVRQAARFQVPARLRRKIALAGGAAFAAKKKAAQKGEPS